MLLNTLRVAAAALTLAAIAPTGPAAPVPAARVKEGKELMALSVKLQGAWLGSEPCQGQLTLRPDGSYEWAHRGPGGETDTGVWALRGEPTAPVLVLNCKASDDPNRRGKTADAKLRQPDAWNIELTFAESEAPRKFARVTCKVR